MEKDKELHICINSDCYIHYYLDKVQIRVGLYDFMGVNSFQAKILESCQESPTVERLMKNIFDTYMVEDNERNRELIRSFLNLLEKRGIIYYNTGGVQTKLKHYGEPQKAYPAWIILELTSKCNLECGFCYKSASTCGSNISMKYVDMIIDHFGGKSKNLVLTGGEALLHPQFGEILEKVATCFDVSLLTNGLLLSKISEVLLDKLTHIQVSMYGYDNSSYEKNVGMKEGFDLLKKSYFNVPKNKKTTAVVTVVLGRHNVGFIEQYIKAACALGAPEIHFGLMLPIGRGARAESSNEILDDSEIFFAAKKIDELSRAYRGSIYVSKLEMVREAIPLNGSEFACQAGKTNIVINQLGDVRACNLLPESVFERYSLEAYLADVESGRNKCYSGDIERFKEYLQQNGHNVSDMKCVGFCELKG